MEISTPRAALIVGASGMQMRSEAEFQRYLAIVFRAMFEQPRNLGDAEELATVLREGGIAPELFGAMIAEDAVKEKLKRDTKDAVARRIRRPHLLRRQRHVLGPGPPALRGTGASLRYCACLMARKQICPNMSKNVCHFLPPFDFRIRQFESRVKKSNYLSI